MNSTLIKVCGMREPENIRQVEALGADWMGFIFWPGSSRYVGRRPDYLPTGCKRVGVFVDAAVGDVLRHIEEYALDIVQLHGHESPDYLRQLPATVGTVKAFSIATPADLAQTGCYEGTADYFLFDTKGRAVGGTGEQFDWSVLAHYQGGTPFLLSGGIGPDDGGRIGALRHPQLAGIDLNSRFEAAPALKDIEKLQTFITKIRNNEQHQ